MTVKQVLANLADNLMTRHSVRVAIKDLSPEDRAEMEREGTLWGMPTFEREKHVIRRLLATQYKRSGNRLYLWSACRFCLKHDLPLPREVQDYLIECADNLLDSEAPPNNNNKIAQAVRLNGRAIANFRNSQIRRAIAEPYFRRLEGFATQEEAAETLGINVRTFRRIVRREEKRRTS